MTAAVVSVSHVSQHQTMLDDYFPVLGNIQKHNPSIFRVVRGGAATGGGRYEVVNPTCPTCGRTPWANGWNRRIRATPGFEGNEEIQVRRYKCRECGEVAVDYGEIAPRGSKYQPELPDACRLMFAAGLTPGLIRVAVAACTKYIIPASTIRGWLTPILLAAESLLEVAPPPTAGNAVYDEIHCRVAGDKMFLQVAADPGSGFVLLVGVFPVLTKGAILRFIVRLNRSMRYRLTCIISDGNRTVGAALQTDWLAGVEHQTCLVHLKRRAMEAVYLSAGQGRRFEERLPARRQAQLQQIFAAIDAQDEGTFHYWLGVLRAATWEGQRDRVQAFLDRLDRIASRVLTHNRVEGCPPTTNLVESINAFIERYHPLKKGLLTSASVRGIAALRCVLYNCLRFPVLDQWLEREYAHWNRMIDLFGRVGYLKGVRTRLGTKRRQFRQCLAEYESFCDRSFGFGALSFIQRLWAGSP